MQHFGKMNQRRLARPVGERLGQAAITGNAGNKGNAAAGFEIGQYSGRQAHGSEEIDLKHLLGLDQIKAISPHRHVVTGQIDDQIDAKPGKQ